MQAAILGIGRDGAGPGGELPALGLAEQRQLRDAALRIRDDGVEQPREVAGQPRDGGGVEQVGRIDD